ncbi:uncharacterized protein LOC102718748 [Oryza brachyantha]|uniref:Uncharacterized protein n=1 Tax=Oryza brachyantha TaxID=4533 RepID=J3MB97_ORYBR|nr:uncharacterized protein LOC102718748 [Oryza brachyantha]
MANPDDPLLDPPPPAAASNRVSNNGGSRVVPWVAPLIGLAVNLALCIYRAEGDRAAIAFACFAYLNLLLLFCCIHHFDQAPSGSPARGRIIRVAVWLLAASLAAVFTWKVAAMMPLPVAAFTWVMAAATVVGGFYGFFIHEYK